MTRKRNKNNKARMVAGYCWDWKKDSQNNPDSYDITIPEYNFAKSWNLGVFHEPLDFTV